MHVCVFLSCCFRAEIIDIICGFSLGSFSSSNVICLTYISLGCIRHGLFYQKDRCEICQRLLNSFVCRIMSLRFSETIF